MTYTERCELCIHWHRAYNRLSMFKANCEHGWCEQIKDFTLEEDTPKQCDYNYERASDEELQRREADKQHDRDLMAELKGKK